MRTVKLAGALVVSLAAVTVSAAEIAVPPHASQHALAVAGGPADVRARACSGPAACDAVGGDRFVLPEGLRDVRHDVVSLEGGRQLVRVQGAGSEPGAQYVLLLGASAPGTPPAVRVVHEGWVGRSEETTSGARTPVLLEEPLGSVRAGTAAVRLVRGAQYASATACGRPATLAARQLDPATLAWTPTYSRSLDADALDGALRLPARRLATPPAPRPRLLHAQVASSAVGTSHLALTDGDPATAWQERREGDGRGELVSMSSTAQVPIVGFELVLRPDAASDGVAPAELHLATADAVLTVTLPEDAWAQPPGTIYEVSLPAPVRTDCLTLVLGAPAARGEAPTTVAELRAQTPYDERLQGRGYPGLVEALDGPRAEGEAAAALLQRGGPAAVKAAIEGFDVLGEGGRYLALRAIAAGGCGDTAAFFTRLMLQEARDRDADLGPGSMLRRAQEELRGCRGAAAVALREAVREGTAGDKAVAARELALVAPDVAVPVLAGELGVADADARRPIRAALAEAARTRRAARAMNRELAPQAFGARPLLARIDLLRAAGAALPQLEHGPAAFSAALDADASFRTRYLLLVPASHLAQGGDAHARSFLEASLTATDSEHLRAGAAAVVGRVEGLRERLVGALADDRPRVREAALQSLSGGGDLGAAPLSPALEASVLRVLAGDGWPFVREAAAQALATQGAGDAVDRTLVAALDDESSRVRRAVLEAIAARRSQAAADRVHELADDPREAVSVRVAAIGALGALCRADAVPLLTKLAVRAGASQLPYDQPLGLAALAALGAIGPADLRASIAPLLHRSVSRSIRQLAEAALRGPPKCAPRS